MRHAVAGSGRVNKTHHPLHILFAFLLSYLLNLPVIDVHYPGHLATAVASSGKVEGDAVSYNGRVFTVADPTYVNANAGMAMPQFKKSTYKIIEM